MANEVVNYYENYREEDRITTNNARRIEFINNHLIDKKYQMETAILDATDMSMFADESFDVVLNMGPFYHLISEDMRRKCFAESMRVLKKGGLLVTAYIPRLYLNQMIVMSDTKYIDETLLHQIRNTGVLKSDDPKCFWTDTYYSSHEEMQQLYKDNDLTIEKHFAQDGMAPMFHKTVDTWSNEQFETWFRYHLAVCEEKSIIDMSNHAVIVGRKN